MKFLILILTLAVCGQAQIRNSYGKLKWGLKGATIYVDTTGYAVPTYKSVGTADTSKAFPFGQGNSEFIMSWTHGSNGDDSGQFSVRFLCYDKRINAWADTGQYQRTTDFLITKSATTLRDTLPGIYQGRAMNCDSLRLIIKSAAGTNAGDTAFIRSLQMRTIYNPGGIN